MKKLICAILVIMTLVSSSACGKNVPDGLPGAPASTAAAPAAETSAATGTGDPTHGLTEDSAGTSAEKTAEETAEKTAGRLTEEAPAESAEATVEATVTAAPPTTAPDGTTPPATAPDKTTPPATSPAETTLSATAPDKTTPPATAPYKTTPPTIAVKTIPPTTAVKTTPPTASARVSATAHTHSYKTTVKDSAPTCTAEGERIEECECGAQRRTAIPALGHNWNPADCEKPKTCKVCGKTEGSALGHTWKSATCTAPKTCTVCGKTTGSANGHTPGNWEVKTPATTTSEGQEIQKCTVCGAVVNTRAIPKLSSGTCSHNYIKYVIKEGDTQANTPFDTDWVCPQAATFCDYYHVGWVVYYCDKCGQAWETAEYGVSPEAANTEFMGYLNDLRRSLGLNKLETSQYALAIAQQRAQEIVTDFSHNGCQTSAECIAQAISVRGAFEGWKASTGHYNNMVTKGLHYGAFGYATNGTNRWLYSVFVGAY